jgi:NAD(P)-dependent dehydrogenase (short-subunit alcohol dehydrogenase family)
MIPNCIAIVTGAGGSGCGRAIARQFAKSGGSVVASDINENGHETVRLIEGDGGRAVFFRADVRDEQQVRDLIAFGEQTYGRVTDQLFWAWTIQGLIDGMRDSCAAGGLY